MILLIYLTFNMQMSCPFIISTHLNKQYLQIMSKIKCQIIEASSERVKFVLNNCDVSLANALRRIFISEVPTMAPHLTWVYENTSVLHDQFLAQRIGLVPFYSQKVDSYKYPWKCNCAQEDIEDCQICKVQFRLQVHHKDIAQNKYEPFREVTSLDIQPVQLVDQTFMHQSMKPVLPVKFYSGIDKTKEVGIPIVKLNRGEQINVRFHVQKGIGKMHAKWSPVQLATFHPDPQIKINHDIETTQEEKEAIRDSCPTKVFEVHNGSLEVVNLDKCVFCGECQKKAEALSMQRLKNYIKIGKKKDKFIFTVESIGSIPAPMIVKNGMKVLRQKMESIEKMLKVD